MVLSVALVMYELCLYRHFIPLTVECCCCWNIKSKQHLFQHILWGKFSLETAFSPLTVWFMFRFWYNIEQSFLCLFFIIIIFFITLLHSNIMSIYFSLLSLLSQATCLKFGFTGLVCKTIQYKSDICFWYGHDQTTHSSSGVCFLIHN